MAGAHFSVLETVSMARRSSIFPIFAKIGDLLASSPDDRNPIPHMPHSAHESAPGIGVPILRAQWLGRALISPSLVTESRLWRISIFPAFPENQRIGRARLWSAKIEFPRAHLGPNPIPGRWRHFPHVRKCIIFAAPRPYLFPASPNGCLWWA